MSKNIVSRMTERLIQRSAGPNTTLGNVFRFFAAILLASSLRGEMHFIVTPGTGRMGIHIEAFFKGSRDGSDVIRLPEKLTPEGTSNFVKNVSLLSDGSIAAGQDDGKRIIAHRRDSDVRIAYDVFRGSEKDRALTGSPEAESFFYDSGRSLFVTPDWPGETQIQFHIEWRGFPPTFEVGNSYDVGKFRQRFDDSLENFRNAVFLGGDFRFSELNIHGRRIEIARRGAWRYSDLEADRLLRRLYETEGAFWPDYDFAYRLVALIPTDAPAGNFGGEGRTRAFCMHLSTNDNLGFGPLHMFAHELFHGWNPTKLRWDGESVYWFTEGFTDYYATEMLKRAGLCSESEYVGFVNDVLKGYHLSKARNFSYERLMKERDGSFDTDRMIYRRGFLLALNWDAEIRHNTRGKKSLDDAMRQLLKCANSDQTFRLSETTIASAARPLLRRDAGTDIATFMQEGKTMTIFDPTLRGTATLETMEFPTFDLGFDPGSFKTKVIAGVEPNSNAYQNGLRDGQKIVSAALTGSPTNMVELVISDAATDKTLKYLPAGPVAAVPQFGLVSR
jgi:predicted metalloprotease with PDZ domain